MALVALSEVLAFVGETEGVFEVTAYNCDLYMATDFSTFAAPVKVSLAIGSYVGGDLAMELKRVCEAAITLSNSGHIKFTISWNSSTRKFTFATPTAGHTVGFKFSNSSAAALMGLTADHALATSWTSDAEVTNSAAVFAQLATEVEKVVSGICGKNLESATYKEWQDGQWSRTVFLKNYPVTSLKRVVLAHDGVMRIMNSSTTNTASVGTTATGLVLELGGVYDTTILWASSATVQAVVNAVNALGSGWSAVVVDSLHVGWRSTEIIEQPPATCRYGEWCDFYVLSDSVSGMRLYEDSGMVVAPFVLSSGKKNVFIEYVAGYTSVTVPQDLKLAIKLICKHFVQKIEDNVFGLLTFSAAGISAEFLTDLPREATDILEGYRRRRLF